ncbi:MAG TPA: pyridoxamine 5'-phosphate oxidase family protein [Desulfomonilaceae bacterium]|nr:pyridoxamine 5'-phosphate oxidase family protein [Desulfomonilaceae bacterium]
MRRHEQEITDRKALEEILRRALVCRIGLSDANRPYVVPVCFGYANDCIYVHSSPFGHKMDIIKNNCAVCFELDVDVELVKAETACKWSVKYLSVIGFGKASVVRDPQEKVRGLNAIMEHYSGSASHDYEPRPVDAAAVIRIEIQSMTGKRSKS